MKKLTSFFSALILSLVMSVTAFAETIGASTPNPETGVTIDWLPIALAGGALVVAIIVFVVMSIKKKNK